MDYSRMTDPSYAPDLEPQKGRSLSTLCAFWIALTGVIFLLRVWSRVTNPKGHFGKDDWTAFASWPLVAALNLLIINTTRSGLGRHTQDVPLGDLIKGFKLMYAGYLVHITAISLVRFSAILFYSRIFNIRNSSYRFFIWAGFGLNAVWMLAFVIWSLVACIPVTAFWNRLILPPSSFKCSPTMAYQWASAITSVVIDLVVLLLPVPRLWKLQISLQNKIRIIAVFMLGYCVIIFTIGRLVSLVRAGDKLNGDITWYFVTSLYWYSCETSVASISISIPVVYQLGLRARRHGLGALLNSKEYTEAVARPAYGSADNGFIPLRDGTKSAGLAKDTQIRIQEVGHSRGTAHSATDSHDV